MSATVTPIDPAQPAPAPATASETTMAPTIIKAVGAGLAAAGIFYMEIIGHVPQGTFVNMVAIPVLIAAGIHTTAKTLN